MFKSPGERAGELVGAACALAVAVDAAEDVGDVGGFEAVDEASDALEVAVAAAGEGHVVYLTVLDVEVDEAGASPGCLILIMHCQLSVSGHAHARACLLFIKSNG